MTEAKTHWWMVLPAIPSEADSDAYRRLRKIWADKTRFRGKGIKRAHEFVTREWETHLMTTLWENFALFEPKEWLRELSDVAGIRHGHEETQTCNWSYGFRERATKRIADIVIGFDGLGDKLGCYVIEAKRPGGKLTEKDLDPSYYLQFEHIATNAAYRKLIYCVDPKEKRTLLELFRAEPEKYQDCGVVTWEEVAGIQIQLAKLMDATPQVRSFIAGSIQYQYCQHGLVPSKLSEDYLALEPSVAGVDIGIKTPYDNHDPQWSRVGNTKRGVP